MKKWGKDGILESSEDDEDNSILSQAISELPTHDTIGFQVVLEERLQGLSKVRKKMSATEGTDKILQDGVTNSRQFSNEISDAADEKTNEFFQSQSSIPLHEVNSELRSRRRRSQQQRNDKKKRKAKDEDDGGIFGTKLKPGKWSLSNYFQSVASTKEKRVVAVAAWFIALAGLVVSLVFVTLDFLQARREQATAVNYVDSDILELPSVWICTVETEAPPFSNLPTRVHKGQPLFWMDSLRVSSANNMIVYPETTKISQMTVESVDVFGTPCKLRELMDPIVFERELQVKPRCFYCFMLSRTPAISLVKYEEGKNDEHPERRNLTSEDRASIRVSQNSFMPACKTSQMAVRRDIFYFFRDEIRSSHIDLQQKGILNFGSFDPENTFNDQFLWPPYRRGFRNSSVDYAVYDIVDMFCNTYMFAGYFYPSTENDIKFRFDEKTLRWKRNGTGPYYPRKYSDFYTSTKQGKVIFSDNRDIGKETFENSSLYSGTSIHVLTNSSHFGGAETIVVLDHLEMASIQLTRDMIKGRESYQQKVLHTTVDIGDIRTNSNVYYLEFGFSTFLTRVVSDQLTISLPAFIADFFGLTSLFLDVSVYTLLVSPLIVRARKKAIERSRRVSSAEGIV